MTAPTWSTAYDRAARDRPLGRPRPDPPVRRDADQQAAARWLAACGADQIVVDPHGRWNEPTHRAATLLRADPAELAAGWAARVERGRPAPQRGCGRRAARGAIEAELRGRDLTEPGLHLALPGPPRRRPGLHRLEHADPRPGGLPRRREPTSTSSATAVSTASTGWSLRASAPPPRPASHHDRHRRPRPPARPRRPRAPRGPTPVRIVVLDNGGGGIFHFLPQAEAMGAPSSRPCSAPREACRCRAAAALFDLPHRALAPRRRPSGCDRDRDRPDRGRGRSHARTSTCTDS